MKKLLLFAASLFFTFAAFAQNVTYSGQVASIIYNNCTTCHRQGGIAPFPLENFMDAYLNRNAIAADVQSHKMPPWSPDPNYTHFAHERTLTQTQISQIVEWANTGAPRGDSATEPAAPVFHGRSQLVNPQFSKRVQKITVDKTLDEFKFFALSSDVTKDEYIKQIELLPGNNKIVHHIFVFIDPTGNFKDNMTDNSAIVLNGNNYLSGGAMNTLQLIGGWLPGSGPYTAPLNMGYKISPGSFYIIQIHYAPGSYGQSDSTQLNIKYSDAPLREMNMAPLLDNTVNLQNGPLEIPANSTRTFTERFTTDQDLSLISITPHQHLLGKRMKVYAIDNESNDTIRLIDDYWNFHWQGMYTFPKLIHIKPGTNIFAEGTYDNTIQNTDNPFSPPQDVQAGTTTHTEMMQVFFCTSPYKSGDENLSTQYSNNLYCSLWPNPVVQGSNLILNITPVNSYSAVVFSADGRVVQTYQTSGSNERSELKLPDGLQPGVYFLKIFNSANVIAKKFIVQ